MKILPVLLGCLIGNIILYAFGIFSAERAFFFCAGEFIGAILIFCLNKNEN